MSRFAALLIGLWVVAIPPAWSDPLDPPPGTTVEKVVMVFRHGVRAPLPGEAAAGYAREPWPEWSTPAEFLTAHGREAMRLVGVYDRALFVHEKLLPAEGCPSAGDVFIWTNVAQRTIATGEALAEGLAPGCDLPVGHRKTDDSDPLFESSASGAPFDAEAAIGSIVSYTGGLDRLVQRHRAAFGVLEDILGCGASLSGPPCNIADLPSSVTATPDRRGLRLKGPIDLASGTAQVILLQYAEGMSQAEVGWGRAPLARIAAISQLHALLFDVFDRAPYMARHTAFALAPRIVALLHGAEGGRVSFLVGHDNNIAALTSLLKVPVKLPGYALDDPPPGGALGFELLRTRRTGARYVRVFYQAQSLDQMRRLDPLTRKKPPILKRLRPACATGVYGLCSFDAIEAALTF